MLGIIGLGYVGLTNLVGFSKFGVKVVGYDINQNIVESLAKGQSHVKDSKIEKFISSNRKQFLLTNSFEDLRSCEDIFICVPTIGKRGMLDLSIVKRVLHDLNQTEVLRVWIRSTIDDPQLFHLAKTISNKTVISFPEFLREGKCWDDFFKPSLTVIGSKEKIDSKLFSLIKKKFTNYHICSPEEAILVKLASNAFHALKVGFANELADVFTGFELDYRNVMKIFSSDTKLNISPAYLTPGLPFGGPCLPKDSLALANSLNKLKKSTSILSAINKSNDAYIDKIVRKIISGEWNCIGFWGLEFKKGSGDFRHSPIIKIAEKVSSDKRVVVFDQKFLKTDNELTSVRFCDTLKQLSKEADIILTYHDINSRKKVIHWDSFL